MSVQDLRQFTVVVLHPVALIDDHVLPTDLGIVRGDETRRGEFWDKASLMP